MHRKVCNLQPGDKMQIYYDHAMYIEDTEKSEDPNCQGYTTYTRSINSKYR